MSVTRGTEQLKYPALVSQPSEHSDLQHYYAGFLGLAAQVALNWCCSENSVFSFFNIVMA